MSFEPARTKLKIGSLDDSSLDVEAQYNPKELQVDQKVPWQKPQPANKANKTDAESEDGGLTLEFTGAEGRSMSVELLFDGFEPNGRHVDVAGRVKKLEKMAAVMKPDSKDEKERRPHHCVVSWGDRGMPKFKCVIEQIQTKYSMFSSDGVPLRATCTVTLKEADHVKKAAKK
ncbi:MAG: CIS tube protein [Kofleriaceae bacterium]